MAKAKKRKSNRKKESEVNNLIQSIEEMLSKLRFYYSPKTTGTDNEDTI